MKKLFALLVVSILLYMLYAGKIAVPQSFKTALLAKIESLPVQGSSPAIPETKKPLIDEKKATIENKNRIISFFGNLNSVTTMGINYSDYSQQLIQIKPQVDALLGSIPDNDFKNDANSIMQEYIEAKSLWENCLSNENGRASFGSGEEKELRKRYSNIPADKSITVQSIPYIWAQASLETTALKVAIKLQDLENQKP